MDLKSLHIFKAVVEEGSVSGAAEKLGRVQSNISTRLKLLEEDVGKPLFDRIGRKLVLTSEGHVLLGYADRILNLSEEARLALEDRYPGGPFHLGAMESTAAARLPVVTAEFAKQYPDIQLNLHTGTAGALYEKLKNRQLEATLIAEPVEDETLETLPIYEEELVLITPESFPLFTDRSQLTGRTLIGFEPGCAYRGYLERWLAEEGIHPGAQLSMNSYLAIFSSVSAGMGFALVPRSVLDLFGERQRFQIHPLGGKFSKIRTLLVWRRGTLSSNLKAFREQLIY
ncbi:LysR family transcriptional regulator [Sneathiella limimaris]|uniref:LysR family transcriptional regulator n=1 Tax=Sneathiella limimaris TaxID=1964213 RepID=UPI00146AF83B|nr:LysR family transcriptional regulator [Sneathiella limimaris]